MEYVFVILNAIILFVTVTLCSVVIPLLVQDTKTKEVTKRFLLSLCVSDLLRVVLGSGFLIRVGTGLKVSDASCLYEATLFSTSQLASSLVTVFTSLNRFFAVGFASSYQAKMTVKVSNIIIGLNWTLVLLIGSIILMFQRPEDVRAVLSSTSCLRIQKTLDEELLISFALGLTLPSIVVIIVTNIRIYFIIKRVVRRVL